MCVETSAGTLKEVLLAVGSKLEKRCQLNLSECCIDSKSLPRKNGACTGITKYGKGTKLMAITKKRGRPVVVMIASAFRHEMSLV